VIGQGWWPSDGSKLDFAGAVTVNPMGQASGLRRWGRATLLLEQQNGHIDNAFIRRVLSDHYEGTHFEVEPWASLKGPVTLCRHGVGSDSLITGTSLVAQISNRPDSLSIIWCAFGPPCMNVYFPLFLEGEIPEVFADSTPGSEGLWMQSIRRGRELHADPDRRALVQETMGRFQARLDQEAEEFALEGATLKQRGEIAKLQREASLQMQHGLELFEAALNSVHPAPEPHSVLS
jgi:dipeptidase